MDTNTFVNMIAAIAGLVTAVALLLGVFPKLRKAEKELVKTVQVMETVHVIVNQQRTDAQRYNIALTEALRLAGVAVPVDQSLPVPGHPDAAPGQPHDVTGPHPGGNGGPESL